MTKEGKPIGVFRDGDNDVSSKRVFGSIALMTGLAMKVAFSIIALLPWIPVDELSARVSVALSGADGVIWAGSAILGVTVAEMFAKKEE
jgi:hypothetical protein